jgi:hypothetical protein
MNNFFRKRAFNSNVFLVDLVSFNKSLELKVFSKTRFRWIPPIPLDSGGIPGVISPPGNYRGDSVSGESRVNRVNPGNAQNRENQIVSCSQTGLNLTDYENLKSWK